uniref:Annexin n=1 Tax=Taenia asiatica TaxID=60517 RepID=A0A0R3WA18_TAEAS
LLLIKFAGSDAGVIISILAHRSSSQRREIESVFKAHFGKDLQNELSHELSGRFKQAVLWSFGDKAHVNAMALFKAIDRAGTDELMLIDVLCTATKEEIEEIKAAYLDVLLQNKKNTLSRNLEADVRDDTSGDFRKVLIALLQASREEECDESQVKSDSFELYQAGVGWEQLRKIDEIYTENYGHNLLTAISKETSGDYKVALKRIMQTATNLNETIVEMLYKSMKGAGTNDDSLIRILLAHSEENLATLEELFNERYDKTLTEMIRVMATVKPSRGFNANEDAQELEKAMKGIGTDEATIIDVLANRTNSQRREIAQAYKAQYGKDLKERLHKELSGKFRQAVEWSFYDRAHVNAAALQKAMKGAGTNEGMLIDVLCTATNNEVKKIKEAYQDLTQKSLEDDVESETSGNFKRVLVALLQARRETDCDKSQAREDALEIYKAGEDKLGTDESTFTRILCTRSYDQIRVINEIYQDEAGHDLIKAIEKETSGDYKKVLSRIVLMSKDPIGTVAEMLYRSMKGAGTNDDSLIRIILAYSEDSLQKIQNKFDNTYEKTLVEMISGDTSGDYKKFLLAILE